MFLKGPTEGLQGTNTKIEDLMIKLYFRNSSLCITYLFLFLQKEQVFKVLKKGNPRDV